tara:strand:+ start:382 stop:684 length:303 start_codon:yes stop_codon:yes gene_type:complete
MRKITREACQAFESGQNYKKGNTKVIKNTTEYYEAEMYLHGNTIALRSICGATYITNAGYKTNVTKERLNGLTGVHIKQKDFVWYLNGEAWNGEWIKVGE